MKQFQLFCRRYLYSWAGILAFFCIANLVLVAGGAFFLYRSPAAGMKFPVEEFSELLDRENGKIALQQQGYKMLQDADAWSMLLDDKGNVIWEERLPEALERSYTAADIALFSRWYLEGYAVNIWKRADGLLVIGFPPGEVVQVYASLPIGYIRMSLVTIAGALLLNLCLILFLLVRNARRMKKAMEPILQGIHALSAGRPFCLDESGELAEINVRLNHAGRCLMKKDHTRAVWIRGISHDVRTPLSMILGYASEMKENAALPETVRKQADIICRQSERLRDLIENLNLTTKLEYSMQTIQKKPVDPVEIVRQVVSGFLNEGLPEGFELTVQESQGEPLLLNCDSFLIRRMLMNLIQNCIVHNSLGCSITVSVKKVDAAVMFCISDDGCGMDRALLTLLNKGCNAPDMFDQKENTEHGLGLKIVRQIVKAHGGTVRFWPTEPKGLCVQVFLPAE